MENSNLASRATELENRLLEHVKNEQPDLRDAETSTDCSLPGSDVGGDEIHERRLGLGEEAAELEMCRKRSSLLGQLCEHVTSELSFAITSHNAWLSTIEVLRQNEADPRAGSDSMVAAAAAAAAPAAAVPEQRKRLTGSRSGATTPRRSMGDSVLTHMVFNSSVPFATPVPSI